MSGKHIISIDQSTSASKVFLLDDSGAIVRRFSRPHRQFYPAPGRVEHDAEEIWQNVREGIAELSQAGEIAGIAIANQRETTVFWHRATGAPICPAVVWQDVRGEALCKALGAHAQRVRHLTGLALSAYFPAAKAASVLRENPELRRIADAGDLCIDTVDSYLIYRLTGGAVFQTDVSNASRTQLMRLETLEWSEELCALFGIPTCCLPSIAPSDAHFGNAPGNIPIVGVMGDSHAALFGQGCHARGMAKATYGTGSSVMMNVGARPILSQNGLSASVGYSLRGQVCYVLEGNVTCSGDTLNWLRDEAQWVKDIPEVDEVAASVEDAGGTYLVPAFSGLGAACSDADARALLFGMNRSTTRAQMVRAALESIAYQDADIVDAMRRDMGEPLFELRAVGGATKSAILMQFQADLLDCPIRCANASELSALGAGYMAGLSLGIYRDAEALCGQPGTRYEPRRDEGWREAAMRGWQDAVRRCRSTFA